MKALMSVASMVRTASTGAYYIFAMTSASGDVPGAGEPAAGGGGGSAPPPTDLTLVKRGHVHQPPQQPPQPASEEGVQEVEEDYPPFPKRHRALVKQVTHSCKLEPFQNLQIDCF